MKQLILIFFMAMYTATAFAQFPLGSDKVKIKKYFDKNISYTYVQEFKTDSGTQAMCFTKVGVVGDYTFYFNNDGLCMSYEVTYDKKELTALEERFDNEFRKVFPTKWVSADNTFEITLLPHKRGANYFCIVYKPALAVTAETNSAEELNMATN